MEKDSVSASAPNNRTYFEKERECEIRFREGGPFWHLCTPGHLTEILFTNEDEFRFGMNLTGICADRFPLVKMFTFALMSNHVHLILSGERSRCEAMFELFFTRLKRFFQNSERRVDLGAFQPQLIPIDNLNSLRNEIVYVNRNGFVVNASYTPFSYPWGAGDLYFNAMCQLLELMGGASFNSLTSRDKVKICRSKDCALSDSIKVLGDYIIVSSFCKIKDGERYFRDAHHYFNLLSKSFEAFSETAKRLGDAVLISDEEMFDVVRQLCLKHYGIKKPNLLTAEAKLEIAKKMHFDYKASNKQIQRILKVSQDILGTLFPQAK